MIQLSGGSFLSKIFTSRGGGKLISRVARSERNRHYLGSKLSVQTVSTILLRQSISNMSGISFHDSSVDPESSETTFRARLASRQTGDVFTVPSAHSGSGLGTSKSGSAQETDVLLEKNPFKIPSDIDIFLLRDKQREKAKAERERRKTLKVHEKMTCSTLQSAKQSGFKREIQMEEEAEDKELAAEAERLKALRESTSWKIAITKDQVVERETMHDYINQKRQMFLLQYAVTVKKDEIQKLENLAIEEEAKLEKAEEDLEKDAAMFDEFLKENDRNSAQALKIAEKETKAKLEKIIEIRELTAQMMNIQSEIARFEDTLREYVVFKDFLYQLSPKEWRDDYERRKIKERLVKIIPGVKDSKLLKSKRSQPSSGWHMCEGRLQPSEGRSDRHSGFCEWGGI
ncbi:hypothetical protein EYD10_04520 [Varanus komodoensis]|nr:hypothetical protein EYD10_04520 [Varanus komodoensis]